jgi:FkbM family methyltransferase
MPSEVSPSHAHPASPSGHLSLGAYMSLGKWRNALRRRVFQASLPRRITLYPRSDVEHVGSGYGGWPVPLGLLDSSSVVYSVGAGEDVSFDIGLIERTGCQVHSFDPTRGAAQYLAAHPHAGLSFHNIAIWTYSGELRMHCAANPAHIALSAVNLQHTDRSVSVPCRTIDSIRTECGHSEITLLKLTVDGGEYDLVPNLELARWRTRVLIVNLQHSRSARVAAKLVANLTDQGFLPVARRGTGVTFVNVRQILDPTSAELPLRIRRGDVDQRSRAPVAARDDRGS